MERIPQEQGQRVPPIHWPPTAVGAAAPGPPDPARGRYRIDRVLTSDAVAVNFLAWETQRQERVTIRVLRPEVATSAMIDRFQRAARPFAHVPHPNLSRVYDDGEMDGLAYIVVEYLEGETLAARIRRGRVTGRDLARLGADLLSVVEVLHHLGLVHGAIVTSSVVLVAGRAVLENACCRAPDLAGEEGAWDVVASDQAKAADLYAVGTLLVQASADNRAKPRVGWSPRTHAVRSVLRRATCTAPENRWPNAPAFARAWRRAHRWPA
jgi:tRNA A-37 threonylcarbamoyl transferase component Bud32